MYVECTKFDGIWNKAKRNVGEGNLLSAYTWSEGVEAVDVNGKQLTASGEKAPAIFFDNTDYPIWVEFKKLAQWILHGGGGQAEGGRTTIAYIPERQEPELMYKLFSGVCCSMDELIETLG